MILICALLKRFSHTDQKNKRKSNNFVCSSKQTYNSITEKERNYCRAKEEKLEISLNETIESVNIFFQVETETTKISETTKFLETTPILKPR